MIGDLSLGQATAPGPQLMPDRWRERSAAQRPDWPDPDHLAAVTAELGKIGGSGGLVAIAADGALALPFNCAGMYRGYVNDNGIVYTAIYDEPYEAA